jgi:hypothetical protein
VACDKAHDHSAQGGCIRGKTDKDTDAVVICALCEEINWMRTKVKELFTEVSGGESPEA